MKQLKLNILPLIFILLGFSCKKNSTQSNDLPSIDFRQAMREFVIDISSYAKSVQDNFIIIPQNGQELLTDNGEFSGTPVTNYLNAIDGVGREDLFYGYENDNQATPPEEQAYMTGFLDLAEMNGIQVLVTDYCWTNQFIDDSYTKNQQRDYISFAANHRELDVIPPYPTTPFNVNANDILTLAEAKNFLYLLNTQTFQNKDDFLNALRQTDYDILLIDLFFEGTEELSFQDITSLKIKSNGGSRLVIAYMSIGEAEDYRYYWHQEWNTNPPAWLEGENTNWPGNHKVRYWENDWQNIIMGSENSYLQKILDDGFSGVYLDLIDAFEYFEGE